VAAAIERGSEAARAGMRAGDEIISVDGEPARVILARRMEDQPTASTVISSRARAAALLLDGARDSFVFVRFRSTDGAEKSVRLRRMLRERPAAMDARRAGKFAVIHFNSFTPEIAAEMARALKGSLRNARGVVLDLRDNGGGEAEAMTDLASLFLPAGKELGKFVTRAGRTHLEAQTRTAMLSAADAIELFRAPLVILIGARTASAAEVFAAAMREHNRAIVIGENTCGCVLGIRRRHTLPDNGSLEISEVDYRTARGARLEGAGVSPDEMITITRRDLRAGHDRALKRAMELLKSTNWSQAALRD
jgi:carboxyl-terminal processing protease